MGDQGCATCHSLDVEADHARGFGLNRDPAVFQSNFTPMNKATCATCHQPAKAGDSCQQCHNYHTGDMKTLRLNPGSAPDLGKPTAWSGDFPEARLYSLVGKNTRP
jgi:predicted CXXCH cytochrome family protein